MQSNDEVPVCDILRAVAAQLSELGDEIADLEDVVSPGIALKYDLSEGLSDDLICQIQALDRVRQSMADLARLTQHLSEQAIEGNLPAPQRAKITQNLHLGSTKALLGGSQKHQSDDAKPPTEEDAPDAPSELHLF